MLENSGGKKKKRTFSFSSFTLGKTLKTKEKYLKENSEFQKDL